MHDYVIVGAGSAGCVLANRLSEDPEVSVLLIEAGPPDAADEIHMPAAMAALFRSRYDWDYDSHHEPFLNRRRIYLPRGKTLGGSSSINAMIYIRGCAADYDEWRDEHGCEGWGWEDMLPAFKRSEDNERGADDLHGAGGLLPVSEPRARSFLAERFLESAQARGLAANPDFNGPSQDGVGWYQLTQRGGVRASTAAAFLRPALERPNLEVATHLHVTRVLFENGRATGVEALRLDETLTFRAEREVIVAAGTYNSPVLLTHSGIGRPDELMALQIDLVAENPMVGLNLHDHPNAGVLYACDEPVSLKDALTPENVALFEQGQGPLTSNTGESGGFVRTRDGLAGPDVQFHAVPALFTDEGLMPPQEHGFATGACVLKPASRGHVLVVAPDPLAKPLICHNYLAEQSDRDAITAGVRMLMEIVREQPLAQYAQRAVFAPAEDSDEAIMAHVRETMQTIYHPVGTCRMGSDELSVVDTELRVRGVEGLRVVDASVMPTVPRGNTNAPTIALAERAADLIRGRVAAPAAEATA